MKGSRINHDLMRNVKFFYIRGSGLKYSGYTILAKAL
jgi:hypothetical protein